ncbi:Phage Tail Collar Domain [Delftia tsuruhatensis]|uniref:phage tail protein n=1 Tax=Delftia tsuruhatensis TaxID=180282 RepID=UPI001E7E6F02|nr:tail fiber protein [Delftia tsuruhatensis]CAB5690467.1 Phage Tail Collar Domain [Delftia tsuruhatensis]CAC9677024.1 Phage Tail Collar Domain [Delftia tsuruhatensis]
MADPFYGEIRAFGFDFAPANWAFCAGQTIQIQQNSALYSVIGNQFGGNGKTDFALPNLQGNVPMGSGTAPGLTPRDVGDTMGTTQETLLLTQIPPHSHGITAQAAGATSALPGGNLLAQGGQGVPPRTSARQTYASATPDSTLAPTALYPAGGGQSHSNLQPYLALNFCICLSGEFPVRS